VFAYVLTYFTLFHHSLLVPLLGRQSKCDTVKYYLMPTAFC